VGSFEPRGKGDPCRRVASLPSCVKGHRDLRYPLIPRGGYQRSPPSRSSDAAARNHGSCAEDSGGPLENARSRYLSACRTVTERSGGRRSRTVVHYGPWPEGPRSRQCLYPRWPPRTGRRRRSGYGRQAADEQAIEITVSSAQATSDGLRPATPWWSRKRAGSIPPMRAAFAGPSSPSRAWRGSCPRSTTLPRGPVRTPKLSHVPTRCRRSPAPPG
jgi:hypothetical protein